MNRPAIRADRLDLRPLTADAVQALIDGDLDRLQSLAGAVFPLPLEAPPEMADALPYFVERLRAEPEIAPWWARLLVRRETREAVGSAGFGGGPDEAGTVVIGYSVYPVFQGHGYATEAAGALAAWALSQAGVTNIRATIPLGHTPSLRVAEKLGMRPVGTTRDDEVGEVLVFELRRADAIPPAERLDSL